MASSATTQWLFYAVTSGACAALNGVFAKLTTTELTSAWADQLAHILHIKHEYRAIADYAVRALFLILNITFNGVMWGLFTRALTLGSSTVRVSVINTSANFILTALLGAYLFGETLPGIWWVGAAMLVAGSVIIGRRDGGGDAVEKVAGEGKMPQEDAVATGRSSGLEKTTSTKTRRRG